jgi:hypothetical protein
MLVFIILSAIRWENDPTFHIMAGSICALLFFAHVFLNRKWLVSTTKSIKSGKATTKIKRQYLTDVFLLIFWSIAIVTGLLAIQPYLSETESITRFGRIHGVSVRIGIAVVFIHIIQHLKQIRSYLGIKKTSIL